MGSCHPGWRLRATCRCCSAAAGSPWDQAFLLLPSSHFRSDALSPSSVRISDSHPWLWPALPALRPLPGLCGQQGAPRLAAPSAQRVNGARGENGGRVAGGRAAGARAPYPHVFIGDASKPGLASMAPVRSWAMLVPSAVIL